MMQGYTRKVWRLSSATSVANGGTPNRPVARRLGMVNARVPKAESFMLQLW